MALSAALVSKIQGAGVTGPNDIFIFKITASGSYATNGDTLNLAGFFPGGAFNTPEAVIIQGNAGFVYGYVPGTKYADGKMTVRVATTTGTNAPLQEHSAVSYVSGVTGDNIIAIMVVRSGAA